MLYEVITFRVRGYELADGAFFADRDVQRRAQEAVIDDNTLKQVFGDEADPIGQVILLGDVPVRVIGVTKKRVAAFGNPDALQVWIPYTTAMNRITSYNVCYTKLLRPVPPTRDCAWSTPARPAPALPCPSRMDSPTRWRNNFV